MRGDAAPGGEHHQVVGGDADTDVIARLVVGMAGEDRFQLGTGGQLQAVQGGGAEEGLADDPRLQLALRRVHQVVRAQQDVYRAAGRQAVGAIAAITPSSVCTVSGLSNWPRMK